MIARVYHRIISGRKNRVDTSSWLVFPRTNTSAKRRVIRKKRTRDNQLSQAATFCVMSIWGELVGTSAVQYLKVSIRPNRASSEGDPARSPSPFFNPQLIAQPTPVNGRRRVGR